MKMLNAQWLFSTIVLGAGCVAGCDGRPAILPNKDAALRQTSAKFAADAAKRTYEADAPRGGEALARAEVDYTLKELRLGNLSPDDWTSVEVWVNQKYVIYLPTLPKFNKGDGFRHINFQMLYDNQGEHIPASLFSAKTRIEKVEMYRDGKMFDVPLRLAD